MANQIDVEESQHHINGDSAPKHSHDAKTDIVSDTEVVGDEVNSDTRSCYRWRRVGGFFWDSIDGDPQYRAYVRRLDLIFL